MGQRETNHIGREVVFVNPFDFVILSKIFNFEKRKSGGDTRNMTYIKYPINLIFVILILRTIRKNVKSEVILYSIIKSSNVSMFISIKHLFLGILMYNFCSDFIHVKT